MSPSTTSFIIRQAVFNDARPIYKLIQGNTDNLVPRSLSDIVQHIDRFLVACGDDGTVLGTASYTILPEIGSPEKTTVEIQSVCVAQNLRRSGIGRALVVAQLRRVEPLAPFQIIVLTFTPPFFASIGFRETSKAKLIHKIYMGCINCTKHESPLTCPEIAMSLDAATLKAILQSDPAADALPY